VLACRRTGWPSSPRCARASAAPGRWSATATAERSWSSATDRSTVRQAGGRHAHRGGPARQATAHDRDTRRPPPPRPERRASRSDSAWTSPKPACACSRIRPSPTSLPGHHRRSQRRRPDRARPDGRALAGAGGRRARSPCPASRATPARRWRWASARRWRCWTGRLRPHGGGRGDHQPRAAPVETLHVSAVGQLDGRRRRAGRGRALFDTVRAVGDGAVPGTGSADPGRQGLAVDAHALGRTAEREQDGGTGVADRLGLRAGGGRARARSRRSWHPTPIASCADRPGRRPPPPGRLDRSPRCTAATAAARCPPPAMLDDPQRLARCSPAIQDLHGRPVCCSPTTTAPTAACSRRCARWRSPAQRPGHHPGRWGENPLPAVQRGTGRGRAGARGRADRR
jgi:hypothetical protein